MIRIIAISVTNGCSSWRYEVGKPEPGGFSKNVIDINESWEHTPRLMPRENVGPVYFAGYNICLSSGEINLIPPHSVVYIVRKEVNA